MNNTTEEKREAIPNSVSRMLLAGIGVLLQVLWIFWLALKLNDYSTAIQVCTSVLTFLITLRIYGLHINSAYKISWIILILLFPIFGLTIYLLFGRSGAVSVMRRRFGEIMTMLRRYHTPILQQRRALPYPDRTTRNHARYLQDRAGYPAYDNTDVTFYGDTCEALEAQKTALRSAEKFIFMEYHAIEDASAWQELEDILAERAAHGVEVRVFYDDVGSIGFINSKFVKKLAGRGIQCRRFNPVIPILNVFMNNRDHRKITVVDGRVGFTGGYNLAEEYFNPPLRPVEGQRHPAGGRRRARPDADFLRAVGRNAEGRTRGRALSARCALHRAGECRSAALRGQSAGRRGHRRERLPEHDPQCEGLRLHYNALPYFK